MSNITFVKAVIAAGGFLLLCAAPEWVLGQSSPPAAASPAPMQPASAPHGRSHAPPDLLEGLTLSDDQKAKIAKIREDTKSHLAAVDSDKELSPEAADAMRRGYERFENGKILEVLTVEQQQEVRKRVSAWRGAAGGAQYPLRRAPASEQTSPPR
jgi:hypothetical protein